jgi:hypothetical protein
MINYNVSLEPNTSQCIIVFLLREARENVLAYAVDFTEQTLLIRLTLQINS